MMLYNAFENLSLSAFIFASLLIATLAFKFFSSIRNSCLFRITSTSSLTLSVVGLKDADIISVLEISIISFTRSLSSWVDVYDSFRYLSLSLYLPILYIIPSSCPLIIVIGVFSSWDIVAINSRLFSSSRLSFSIISISGLVIVLEYIYAPKIPINIAANIVNGTRFLSTLFASLIGCNGIIMSRTQLSSISLIFTSVDNLYSLFRLFIKYLLYFRKTTSFFP